jgi:hypothetical protein
LRGRRTRHALGRIAHRRRADAGQPAADLPLDSHRRYWWAVRVFDGAGGPARGARQPFLTGVLDPARWPDRWIAAEPDPVLPPHRQPGQPGHGAGAPLPILRRSLRLPRRRAGPCFRSVALARSPGDQRTGGGHAALTPGWTNYRRSALYDTHDVTALLRAGDNVLALMLGNGMYNVEAKEGRYTKFLDSFGRPKAILAMTIEHADGHVEHLASDGQWRWHEGPIRFSSIYGGEDWDARLVPPGWMEPGFDDHEWQPVQAVAGAGRRPARRAGATGGCRAHAAAGGDHQRGARCSAGRFRVNFAGRPRLVVEAPAGATLTVLPGETLDDQGRVSQRSFNAGPGKPRGLHPYKRRARAGDLEPLFTYHGFRWLEPTACCARRSARWKAWCSTPILRASAGSRRRIRCSMPSTG